MTSPTKAAGGSGAGKELHASEATGADGSDGVWEVVPKFGFRRLGRFGRMFPTYVRAGSVRGCACERSERCVRIVRGKEWHVWHSYLSSSHGRAQKRLGRSVCTSGWGRNGPPKRWQRS